MRLKVKISSRAQVEVRVFPRARALVTQPAEVALITLKLPLQTQALPSGVRSSERGRDSWDSSSSLDGSATMARSSMGRAQRP